MFQKQWVSSAPWTGGVHAGLDIWPHWSTPPLIALMNSLLWTATWIHHELYRMHALGFRPKTIS